MTHKEWIITPFIHEKSPNIENILQTYNHTTHNKELTNHDHNYSKEEANWGFLKQVATQLTSMEKEMQGMKMGTEPIAK